MTDHQARILDQFSRQAIPFSNAPSIRDAGALEQLVRACDTTTEDNVLDVACGPGLVVRAFAEVASHVTGIDLTPAMIDRAREHTHDLANVTLRVGDVSALPFPDASFSLVVSRFAFHHFVEPAHMLAEMRRVCRPGGRVMVCDLVAAEDPNKAAAFHALEMQRDPSHARALRRAELEALFDASGLARRPTIVTTLPFELESLIARSFPEGIDRDQLRQLYLSRLDGDGLGLQLRRSEHLVLGAYTVAVIVADRA
jgi:SAM-dependent methyltransferase